MNKILLTLFVLFIANAANFVQKDIFVFLTFLFCAFLIARKKIVIDKPFLILLVIWTVINCISFIVNYANTGDIMPFLGLTIRIMIAYGIVKIVGIKFFDKLFDYLYILIWLSMPFYIIDLIMPSFMSSLAPLLNFMTKSEQTANGGFYIFFYMHSAWGESVGGILRNCGFMWEPGAYSCVLTFMLVYHLHKTKYKFDNKSWVIIISLLTTFSTSGFIALFFVILFSLQRNRALNKIITPILVIAICIIGYNIYNTNEFMAGKINLYLDNQNEIVEVDDGTGSGDTMVKANRVGIAIISIDNAIHRPWGEGAFQSSFIKEKYMGAIGNNSLAELLRQWGWLGLFFLYFAFYSFKINGRKIGWLLPVAMTPVLFSNPFAFRMLIYAIVFSSLCIVDSNNYRLSKNSNNKKLCQYLKTRPF